MNNDNLENNSGNGDNSNHLLKQVVSGDEVKLDEAVSINGSNDANTNEIVSSNNNTSSSSINEMVNPNTRKQLMTDSELLYNFIGNNYQKFIMSKFNFSAFFLSFLYLLFRKMYFYSFLIMFIYVVVPIFIKNTVYLCGIFLTINFILGLVANKIYLKHCDNEINNIRYKYSFYDNDSLRSACRKKGGTSIISVIMGLFLNACLIILFIGLYLYFVDKVSFSDLFKKIVDLYIKKSTG